MSHSRIILHVDHQMAPLVKIKSRFYKNKMMTIKLLKLKEKQLKLKNLISVKNIVVM